MVLSGAAGISLLVALYMALLWAPTGGIMDPSQRILYFHTSAVWVGFLASIMSLVGALLYLRRREGRFDCLSRSSVEIGFSYITVAILTGSVWAKPTWNTWWPWEPHLTTAAILWLIYLSYLMLRRGIDNPEQAARLAAVYTISAFASVPLTYLVVTWGRGIYPIMDDFGPRALTTLLVSSVAFTLLYLALLQHSLRLASFSWEITSLRERIAERGA